MQALIGNVLERIISDVGYRGHNAPPEHQFRVYTTGQRRRVTPLKRELKGRAAIEPVISHLKDDHRMGRNYLAHSSGDVINAVLAAVLLNQWLTDFAAPNLDRPPLHLETAPIAVNSARGWRSCALSDAPSTVETQLTQMGTRFSVLTKVRNPI